MDDKPELLRLAASAQRPYANPMGKDEMLLRMLDELVASWLDTMTPVEIGSDLQKVRLLKEVRATVGEGQPSPSAQQLYQEVFLRDIWSGNGSKPGRPAQSSSH